MTAPAPAAPPGAGRLSIASVVLQGAAWTIGIYALTVVLRFGANVALSRLVAPEIFGTILVVMMLRNGIDQISDVGIGQNVVNNRSGDRPEFLNTAWTVQVVRGVVLAAALALFAPIIAAAYEVQTSTIQLGALTLVILGFTSTSIFMLQRKLQIARLNLFDFLLDLVSLACTLVSALISPTAHSLIVGSLVAVTIRTVSTFFLPDARNRFALNWTHAIEILSFGKWIYAWSLLGFLSMTFDRIYLGQASTLAVLGVYGIARTIADLPVALAGRLGHSLIFPLISSLQDATREMLRRQIAPLRLKFLLAGALCLAPAIVLADVVIEVLYDSRYHDAGWMLPVLLLGGWAAVLCSTGEYVLLGLGKPLYGAAANCAKLSYLAIALPLSFNAYGVVGAVAAIASAEAVRYAVLLAGQIREKLSFVSQDALATACLLAATLAAEGVRRMFETGLALPWAQP